MRPVPSPQPPKPAEHETGEFPATRREMRKTVRFWGSIIGAAFTSMGVGGGAWIHNAASQHIEERVSVVETRHDAIKERLDKLETKVDELSSTQAAQEDSARARQRELLEAIRHGKR